MNIYLKDLQHVLAVFTGFEETISVAVGGSVASGTADDDSDVDVYVYSEVPIPMPLRREVASALGQDQHVGIIPGEERDTWTDNVLQRTIDVAYRQPRWMIEQIRAILVDCTPRLGYSTCTWDNLLYSTVAYDPTNWYSELKKTAMVPYPAQLQKAVISHNYKALICNGVCLLDQLKVCLKRKDLVGANHRLTAILASYFDIIFAANKVTNPGEKRLMEYAKKRCKKLPGDMEACVTGLIASVASSSADVVSVAEDLIKRMETFLEGENLMPGQDL